MVFSFFAHLSFLSAALPLGFGLFQWRRLSKDLKMVVLLAALSLVADTTALVLANHKINTWPIVNSFLLAQSVLLFYALKKHQPISVKGVFYGCAMFNLINFLFIQGPRTFDSYSSYPTAIVMIGVALYFFLHLMKEMPAERVQALPLFWIAVAVLGYYGGNIFVFLFNNYILNQMAERHPYMWTVHNIINTAKNILMFAALWTNYRANFAGETKASL
jgi:hypothetical protein